MNRRQIAAAAVLWFIGPQVALWPFRGTLQSLFPQPTVWQASGMLLGSVALFVCGVYCWSLRQRVASLEASQSLGGVPADE